MQASQATCVANKILALPHCSWELPRGREGRQIDHFVRAITKQVPIIRGSEWGYFLSNLCEALERILSF